MSARSAVRSRASRPEAGENAERYLRLLGGDHAGLSRVLREIDLQQSMLQAQPGAARPVLNEALRYLLVHQHAIHHAREDRLFARVRARAPRLNRSMDRLVREHSVAQKAAERLARDLSQSTLAELRGKRGQQLAQRLRAYVKHAREHMRREEALFYAGAARRLRAVDWASLATGSLATDPTTNPARFAARYPRLAERMSLPQREVAGAPATARRGTRVSGVESCLERFASAMHTAIDRVRRLNCTTLRGAGRGGQRA